jgi:hypothetical protein
MAPGAVGRWSAAAPARPDRFSPIIATRWFDQHRGLARRFRPPTRPGNWSSCRFWRRWLSNAAGELAMFAASAAAVVFVVVMVLMRDRLEIFRAEAMARAHPPDRRCRPCHRSARWRSQCARERSGAGRVPSCAARALTA